MATGIKVFSTTIYFCIVCISAILVAIVELQENIPWLILVVLPFVGGLVVYNLFLLIDANKKVRQFLFTFKGSFSFLCMVFFLALCSTPVNEFTSYLSKTPHPFRGYQWLSATLIGTLLSLSFLNYTLSQPEGRLLKAVKLCKSIWYLKTTYFLSIFSVWMFLVTNFISWKVFDHIPHVSDEIAQLFQAKIFAQGMLTAPLPPIIDFFRYHYDNMIFTTRWYSQYPPGHPFFLMLGLLAKVPWLINPLFASLSVILLYKIALLYYGEKEAKLSVILFCVSPFVLFMSASFMNHASTLFFLLLLLYTLNKAIVHRNGFYALISGLSLGVLFNIRTGDAVAIGVIFCAILFILNSLNKAYKPMVVFVAAVFLMIAVLATYNYATNGAPLLFGYQVRWGTEHTMGFSNSSIMDSPPHTPLRGVIHTLSNGIALNQNLFEWPFPSLIPLFIFWMPFIIKKSGKDYLLLCGLLGAPIFYFFYYYQDLCLGPRLYYICLPFILVLTARAFFHIIQGIAVLRHSSEMHIKNAFIALLFLSVVFAGVFRIPKLYRFYSDSFWYVDNKLMKKVQELGINNALIFQKSYGYKGNALGSGFLYNSPNLQDPVVFARDLGERNYDLIPFFPGRKYYLAARDETGNIIIEPFPKQDKKLPPQ